MLMYYVIGRWLKSNNQQNLSKQTHNGNNPITFVKTYLVREDQIVGLHCEMVVTMDFRMTYMLKWIGFLLVIDVATLAKGMFLGANNIM